MTTKRKKKERAGLDTKIQFSLDIYLQKRARIYIYKVGEEQKTPKLSFSRGRERRRRREDFFLRDGGRNARALGGGGAKSREIYRDTMMMMSDAKKKKTAQSATTTSSSKKDASFYLVLFYVVAGVVVLLLASSGTPPPSSSSDPLEATYSTETYVDSFGSEKGAVLEAAPQRETREEKSRSGSSSSVRDADDEDEDEEGKCSLRLSSLLDADVDGKPFEHVYVREFISSGCLRRVNADFPESLKKFSTYGGGNINEGILRERGEIVGAFEQFLDLMASTTLRKAFESVFRTDLSNTFVRSTIRGVATKEDGRIHADDASKVVTALVYLNEDWPHESECGACGKLQLLAKRDLRSNSTPANDAFGGNLLAFKNPAAFGKKGGFHGFTKFSPGGCLSRDEGCERKMVQINYQTRIKIGGDEKKNGKRLQKNKNEKPRYLYPNDPRIRDGSYELPGGVRLAVE